MEKLSVRQHGMTSGCAHCSDEKKNEEKLQIKLLKVNVANII